MVRKLTTAALILTLAMSLTACGNSNAGTAANRWSAGTNAASQDWAIQRQNEARGPLEDSSRGSYYADEKGQVDGYDTKSADGTQNNAKQDLKQAGDALKEAGESAKDTGKDLGDAAKNAARSVGDAAEDALDSAKNAAKDMTNDAEKAAQ